MSRKSEQEERRERHADRQAGMRFEGRGGKWEDARGEKAEPFPHDTPWPERQRADRERWSKR